MKAVYIINGLGNSEAEYNFYKICIYDQHNEHHVISFIKMGKYKTFK